MRTNSGWAIFACAVLASVLGLGSSACAQTPAPTPPPPTRPNVLLAVADDWGWPHAGTLGDPTVRTPTFDRLATEGVLFTHAFVASPSCTPSRNAVLTGQHIWRLGEGANLHSTLDRALPNFVSMLAEAGYQTAHHRKAWGPGDSRAGGYQQNPCGPERALAEFLAEREPQQPFCFWLGTSDPHRPFAKDLGKRAGIDTGSIRVPSCWPDRPEVRDDLADYYAAVQRWDADVGAALQLLREHGLLDNTLVVMTGDNGMPFPRAKANLYDLGARVPLAVRWGNGGRAGHVESTPVTLVDLAPTFLAAAGLPTPSAMTGRSLLPLLSGAGDDAEPTAPRPDFVVYGRERHTPAQALPSLDGYPSRALRTRDWLLIRNFAPERWPVGVPSGGTHPIGRFADCDNGPTKSLIAAGLADNEAAAVDAELAESYRLCFGRRPAYELYDCRTDPEQLRNLADDSRQAATLAELRQQLQEALVALGDPRAADGKAPFDGYPYRAKYLEARLKGR